MMAEYGKRSGQRRDHYCTQQPWRRRSLNNRKPPRNRGASWHPGVPSWEKTFCEVVGLLDWHTFLEMKRFVHLFDDVMSWDDSAAEEAFHNAKKRFFAQMQGLPCDISTPDPDLYIDEVDWNSQVDPQLIMDLDSGHMIPDTSANDEPVLIFGDILLQQKGFSPPGWGVIEDAANSKTGNQCPTAEPTGWGDDFDDDPWELNLPQSGGPVKPTGWGDDVDDDPCEPNLPQSGGPVKPTGWGHDFDDDPWEPNFPQSGGPVKPTGWGGIDDGRAVEAAEWPTSRKNYWSSNHLEKQTNWRGDNYGTRNLNNGKKKQPSYRKTRFRGDGMGQNKAACF